MKIAIAQLNYTIGDVDGNASKIIDSINKAKAQRADLVIFAEQAVSGLLPSTCCGKRPSSNCARTHWSRSPRAATASPPSWDCRSSRTTATTQRRGADPGPQGARRYVGKKVHHGTPRDGFFLTPSKGFEYATIKGHKCAIIVGDDLSREHDFDQSVETVISINARKYGKGTMTYRYEMMRHLAFVEGKNLVLVNQVGGSTDIVTTARRGR